MSRWIRSRGPGKSYWRPLTIVFVPYSAVMGERCLRRPGSLRIIVNKPLVLRLTKDIIQTYQICNPTFTYSESFNPKRYLTNPSTGVLNKGLDNVNSDYILRVNAVLVNSDGNRRYIVKDLLGQGTFGQVVKCWCSETNNFVAVKVIKNQPAYYHQSTVEISILTTLNQKFDPEDNHHIVRICDHFVFHGHLCIVFEMLGANLYELIKTNQFRGISLNLLKLFAKQILDSLLVLRDASVIHCDLKPENILLTTSMHSAEIKLIDFGSACMENETVYSYIQSRFYRSPEVVLGHPYTTAIDMWSFGCIAAELFLGLPLFPGASEYDLMRRMIERLGGQPPDQILRTARNTSKYFKHVGSFLVDESQEKGGQSAYKFLSESEYEAREKKKPASSKRYFNYVNLKDIILNYPHRKKMTKEELARENQIRLSFIDFLRGLVQFDPLKRWTPRQAAQHPFLTEQPFTGPYRPFPEAPHLHGCHGIMMDDNPAPSHGFGACCYPQVINTNLYAYDSSPRYQPTQFDQIGSCNSFENHHIHEEGFGFTNNCACKANTHTPMSYCPPASAAWNCRANAIPAVSCLGQSPETWCRTIPIFQGQAEGVSTSNGVFRSMYFGVRPSQFHSSYQVQPSPSSPVKQGLDSTARDGMVMQETGLERSAAIGQYHKMKGVGLLGNSHLSHQESVMPLGLVKSPYYVSENLHKGSASYTDQNSHAEYLGSRHWDHESSSFQLSRQSIGINANTGLPLAYDQKPSLPNCSVSKNILLTTEGMCSTGGGKNLPALGLGDWDSNYRNDLIFQEEGSDRLPPCSKSSECIRSEQDSYLTTSYVAGACRPVQSYIHVQGSPYRPDRLIEGQSDIKGSPTSVHGLEVGYIHPLTTIPHQGHNLSQQKSPSQRELQSSLFFKQQFQHPYDSKQNPAQHLPFNVTGMQQTCYPPDPPDMYSQTTCISYSQVSAGKDAENSPGCLLPSQRDSQADYGQNSGFISSSKGFHDVSGINSFVPLRTTALHLVHLGQRNPLGDLPAAVHGIQYHKGTG